ncbi:MAG: tRNA preQ1(34) S-adenosylmethionine ribosyltransferase-isomerase QueA [Magnetovibrionaceae bacterium]
MRVDAFDFDLPTGRIAQRPVEPRDHARLLGIDRGLADLHVFDLPRLLNPADILVFNNTKVIPARLFGQRGEVPVEATLHKRLGEDSWEAFCRPGKRLKPGHLIRFRDGFEAEVLSKGEGGLIALRFNREGAELFAALEVQGAMPLPPYIKREQGADDRDKRDYQTIFADRKGAVAAPTAGLHFTDRLLSNLAEAGVRRTTVTLHVGAGTFLPVKVDDTADHKMHAEWGEITENAVGAIQAAKRDGGRVIAVGTTSLRLLESAAADGGELRPFSAETDIFITPGFRFNVADQLLTNFHLPKSTLFMLVSAFSGLERMRAAYDFAIRKEYRFYSYGDASLLTREDLIL